MTGVVIVVQWCQSPDSVFAWNALGIPRFKLTEMRTLPHMLDKIAQAHTFLLCLHIQVSVVIILTETNGYNKLCIL